MILALLLIPMFSGIIALFTSRQWMARTLLIVSAAIHLSLVVSCIVTKPSAIFGGWLALDDLGLLFLGIASLLFFLASIYKVGVRSEGKARKTDFEEGFLFRNSPEALSSGCQLLLLTSMTLVCVSQQVGLIWVAVEATTIASAPLIFFHRHRRSLEAAWKYLLICSVGIALALLGNLFLAIAQPSRGAEGQMLISQLIDQARLSMLDPVWLKAAFVLLLVGYGTKMGLAPMHTWLPDAHSEAPSVISALLSGALLNTAFLAILRSQQILNAAGLAEYSGKLLVWLGIISMFIGAVFIIGQLDYKRMLAYSSVEHMGLMAVGIGLGGSGIFSSLLHSVNHSMTKGMLFLAAGNILGRYRSKRIADVQGVSHELPWTGVLWFIGLFAITGFPPFGTFISEYGILREMVFQGRFFLAVGYLLLLAAAFIGMSVLMVRMSLGRKSSEIKGGREPFLSVLSPILLAAVSITLGIYIPKFLSELILRAQSIIGGA